MVDLNDPEVCELMGVPHPVQYADEFLAEIKKCPSGVSPRQMHRLHKHVDEMMWMRVGAWLHKQGKVRHEWRPLAQPNAAIQESCYILPAPPAP